MTTAAPWTCDACGAGNNPVRAACWICYEPRARTPAPVPRRRRAWRTEPKLHPAVAGVLCTILGLIGLGFLATAPGLGFLYFGATLPVFLLVAAAEGWRKAIAVVAVMVGVILAVVVALFLTCMAVIFSGRR